MDQKCINPRKAGLFCELLCFFQGFHMTYTKPYGCKQTNYVPRNFTIKHLIN